MSDALLKKMQFKEPVRVYVRGAPAEFKPTLADWKDSVGVGTSPNCKRKDLHALYFVKSCADVKKFAKGAAAKIEDDGVLWFAYPKKSSKKYDSDISRDDGWQPLGELGFEGVRQVAIDEDWSALRFRRVGNIKSFKREARHALSKQGKRRASRKGG